MPVNVTYPGVYVDEVKSSVKTITGVPTAVAAFVGYAPRGPADRPVHITGWADYQAIFGGLRANCPLSYAVYQFYLNGGSEAEIVRVVKDDKTVRLPLGKSATRPAKEPSAGSAKEPSAGSAKESPAGTGEDESSGEGKSKESGGDAKRPSASGSSGTASANGPALLAASPGRWALSLRARVDYDTLEGEIPDRQRKLFNLTVRDLETGAEERYLNVSVEQDSPRNLANLLATSLLVRADPDSPLQTLPTQNSDPGPKDDPDPFKAPPEAGNPPICYTPAETGGGRGDADERPRELTPYLGDPAVKTGLHQLLKTDIFNILCLPDADWLDEQAEGGVRALLVAALQLCVARRAILLVDPPAKWTGGASGSGSSAIAVGTVLENIKDVELGESAKNAAVYYPRVLAPDPLSGALRHFPPSGVMAGVLARTDVQRGVWKAPAGTDASLSGVSELEVPLTDLEIGRLNPVGVNCLRRLPAAGPVAWGARTLRGADRLADEWKYLPVRRLALFIEESLFRGTHWVVFEPNDEPLWASIRLNIGAFMNSLFRAGAFQGQTPQDAYLVKCDKDTNPQNDIDRGIVNIQVGFAPLKPAEFVIVHIQQLAGQIQV
ncbi:phage tail sheath C-terminal domain-containing protein [Streptomyces sp. MZ04]|uniref:phage tail sheath family protein n=1 Tax=Streptomyces sp. MZ04 TaxID=2559236 RepID=UPI00107ED75A|nr:phage tail sheath C-terminal domain-containing protein [Streptomyces sp. MZ04]TGA95165.1 phage tail sheath family protein [Streptomyces sp. MZ04]